ncbi:major facilitator superfamily MFS-1 [Thelephora ganbajun]|uniref:Major facilitator superfamily MFS-1 n=1 Tax=Thelephora ganbajun TaxID=370292 RepID=A0ACB6ZW12_THEGA|nr:major facilitator superfamily MFS-1 [Thelephora ganbajun]
MTGPTVTRGRAFGPHQTTLHVDETPVGRTEPSPQPGSRFSPRRIPLVSQLLRRWGRGREERSQSRPPLSSEQPPIPSALAPAAEADSSPLPTLSMVVLSITLLGEFLSANVSTPFLLFMVKGFGQYTEEADVGFWTGILTSSFFLTQFVTSLLWATVAEKHGQRIVLLISLIGTAVTCFLFGTSTSMNEALVIRLLQGTFAGAIGVARGTVAVITDQTNEGRAWAVLGFCWGLGGVAGAIIGATFESPAQKWPSFTQNFPFFASYPYALPCAVAASVTLIGGILCLFLGRDGGPREGAIRLPDKENRQPSPFPRDESPSPAPSGQSTPRQFHQKVLGYFTPNKSQDFLDVPAPELPLASSGANVATRRDSGSAYGYSRGRRPRLSSAGQHSMLSRALWRRRGTGTTAPGSFGQQFAEYGELNFAQRLLMANGMAVNNVSDLWVSAAMNVDESVFEDDEPEGPYQLGFQESAVSLTSADPSPSRRQRRSPRRSSRDPGTYSRRPSGSTIPAIFSNSGMRTPPAILEAHQLFGEPDTLPTRAPLEAIPETDHPSSDAKAPPLYSQLPIIFIVHYGLLALHTTTHDQVFYLYLVSKYPSGGLNLDAGHFGQLIALMCLFQIAYQFYFYPNVGPPRGRFSHLAMFRIGSALFVPSYLTVALYRPFASANDDGSAILMAALSFSTAIRYCATTFSYTAISVLLNYMSPPHVVGYANGIAQSIVSFSRFLGPIIGGTLWSASVDGNPNGYPLGFLACSIVCVLAVLQSFWIK